MLVMDETHTISSGPGGYARANHIDADAIVVGKPMGGGVPCAVYGLSDALAKLAQHAKRSAPPGHSGIGTTLTANMLAATAMRANLEHVMTDAAYAHMFQLAEKLAGGLRKVITKHAMPWCVTQVGARIEFQFSAAQPTNGTEAGNIFDDELERVVHLYLLNRGMLITPFHNMMLVCPATTVEMVNKFLITFEQCIDELKFN
jgi:glutamate-1-semialdehyde 2,1-aminomutase